MSNRDVIASGLLIAGAVVGLAAGVALGSPAAPGARPDRSFGGGKGWVVTRVPGTSTFAEGVAVLRGGGIVAVGEATTASGRGQLLVVRYRPNGQLDRSFGARGVFRSTFPAAAGPFVATAVAADRSTGKLVIAGGYGMAKMLVMRLTARGKLDHSFGANRRGFAMVAIGGIAQSIALDGNEGILLGGSNANQNGRPMIVARLTNSGLLDRGFGHQGVARLLFWNPALAAGTNVAGLAVLPSGAIEGFGHIDYIGSDGHGTAGVFELSRAGRPDRSFAADGHIEIAFPHGSGSSGFASWLPCAMTLDARGAATIIGGGLTKSGSALLSARLTSNGALDRSYGRGGRSVIAAPKIGSETTCGATATPGDGLAVGVGSVLAEVQSDGSVDGHLSHVAGPRKVGINAVARWGVKREVLTGFAGNAAYVGRYVLATGR